MCSIVISIKLLLHIQDLEHNLQLLLYLEVMWTQQ